MAWNPLDVKFKTGPNCEGCPFRAMSVGFTIPQGYDWRTNDRTGAWEKFEPSPRWRRAEYLLLAEAPGKDEAKQGGPMVGGTGRYLNGALNRFTPLRRIDLALSNVVLCRPVKHGPDGKPLRQSSGDFINATPPPEQIRECHERYGKVAIEAFTGHTIVGLGVSALSLFAGVGKSMAQNRGAIFEHGEMLPCPTCEGAGHVPRPRRVCSICKKRGVLKCEGCGKYKHPKKCTVPSVSCSECGGVGTLPRDPKTCPECRGSRQVPSDPDNPYVSTLLRPSQLFFPTYHPAAVLWSEKFKSLLEFDLRRITGLRDELVIEESLDYNENPDSLTLTTAFAHKRVSLDLETTCFIAERGDIQMIGCSTGPGKAVIAPGDSSHAANLLKQAETDDSITVIGQNWCMFDAWWVWKHWGIGLPKRLFDTRLAGHLLNPDTPNNIHYLVAEFAKPPIRGFWKTREDYRDNKRLVCSIDVDGTFRVADGQATALEQAGLVGEYWNEVYPTMRVAWDMRVQGWRVNLPALARANVMVAAKLGTMRESLPDWPGTNGGTVRTEGQSERVRDYMYNTLRLPVQVHKRTGQPSADWESRTELLIRLKTGHESIEKLPSATVSHAIEFLELINDLSDQAKLLTFLRPDSPHLTGDRFHPTWNPVGTATYRFSCDDPNLQQVPKCACEPACGGTSLSCLNARFPFIGDEDGWDIITADYSQIEVVGFLWSASEWTVLRKCLFEGLDAHAVMGELLGMPRKDAKHMTFAMTYGAEDATIAAKSGKPIHVVAEARAQYLKTFPGVADFRWRYISEAMKHGYVTSPFGRRRYIWTRSPVGRAANQAANAPIQGIPPMVIRRAMRTLHAQLPSPARILGNLHDEIIFTCPPDIREEVISCIKDVMRTPVPELSAPQLGMTSGLVFNVAVKVGSDWSKVHGQD